MPDRHFQFASFSFYTISFPEVFCHDVDVEKFLRRIVVLLSGGASGNRSAKDAIESSFIDEINLEQNIVQIQSRCLFLVNL